MCTHSLFKNCLTMRTPIQSFPVKRKNDNAVAFYAGLTPSAECRGERDYSHVVIDCPPGFRCVRNHNGEPACLPPPPVPPRENKPYTLCMGERDYSHVVLRCPRDHRCVRNYDGKPDCLPPAPAPPRANKPNSSHQKQYDSVSSPLAS